MDVNILARRARYWDRSLRRDGRGSEFLNNSVRLPTCQEGIDSSKSQGEANAFKDQASSVGIWFGRRLLVPTASSGARA